MLKQLLKDYRFKHNLTQCQMAEKLETSQSYYCQIETGYKKPSFVFIRKLAKLLNVEESFIRSLL